jgi:hypothetical protein
MLLAELGDVEGAPDPELCPLAFRQNPPFR